MYLFGKRKGGGGVGRRKLKKKKKKKKRYASHEFINPFSATACQIAGLNDALTRRETVYIYTGPITYLLSMLCVFMKILAKVDAKKHKKA